MKWAPPSVGVNNYRAWKLEVCKNMEKKQISAQKLFSKVEEKLVFNGIVELFEQQFC
jgi:hypothetical protein